MASNKTRHTYDWTIGPTSIPTDHWLATVKYAPKGAPHIRNGRWMWPLKALSNTKLVEKIEKMGMALQQEVNNLPQRSND